MSTNTIATIEAAGLKDDFELLFATFFKKDDAKAKASLLKVVDQHGLQCSEVIREVGALQRAEVLEPGIYKAFKDLNAKLADGGNGASNEPVTEVETKPAKEPKVEAKSKPAEEPEVEAGGGGKVALTDSDEEDIRAKLRAEEEKWRAKLAEKERKLREQKIKKNKKSAQKMGLKAEEVAKIKELKEQIADIQEVNKKLKAEIKANNDQIKVHRAEIVEIRPKKQKTETTSDGKKKPASAAKVDARELEAAVEVITEFLKEHPGSKSGEIKKETGVDGALYNAAISSMKTAGKVEQGGRGPFTNYTLC